MPTQKILVDTDVLIDFLRKKEKAAVILKKALSAGDLYISVITLAEILSGMRPAEEDATESFLSGFNLIPINEPIARQAGHLRNQYKAKNILLPDCLIAATSIEEKCTLLTFNKKDYPFKAIQLFV